MPHHGKSKKHGIPNLEELLEHDSRSSKNIGKEFEIDKDKIYQANAKVAQERKEREPLKDHKSARPHVDRDRKSHYENEHEDHKGKGHHGKDHHQSSHHVEASKKKAHKPSVSDGQEKHHGSSRSSSSGGSSSKRPQGSSTKEKILKKSILHDKPHHRSSHSNSVSSDKPTPRVSRKSTVSFTNLPRLSNDISKVVGAPSPLDITQKSLQDSNALTNPQFQTLDAIIFHQPPPATVDPTSHIDAIFNSDSPPPNAAPLGRLTAGHTDSGVPHQPPGRPGTGGPHHPPGQPGSGVPHHPPGHSVPGVPHHHPGPAHHIPGTGDHIGAPHPHPGAPHDATGPPNLASTALIEAGPHQDLAKPEDDLIIKAHDGLHVVLLKKFGLLLIIFLIMIIDGIAILTWSIIQNIFGAPPTYYSGESFSNTLVALVFLFLVCLFSIIVIKWKVRYPAVGYLLMFAYGVTLYRAMKGASRAHISIKYDDIATIEKYIFKNESHRSGGSLPDFFHRIQSNFECCGTTLVDKMEDWPKRLATIDIPKSCCQKVSTHCGDKLARTYKYDGSNKGAYRTPSGFMLALTMDEMTNVITRQKPIKIIFAPGTNHGMQTVLKILSEFYFKKLKQAYPPGTPIDSMRRLQNDIINPPDIKEGTLPASLGCRDHSTPEKPTLIGWEIQLEIDKETSKVHVESEEITYDWVAWKIPVCREATGIPPFDLAANINRGDTTRDIKQMWYISRGITENYVLKDLLWEIYCENPQNEKYIPFTPSLGRQWHHPAVGRFYIAFVNQVMFICFCYSISVIICLVIVFLIFYNYYSKMKLEEFANLPYPQEFDVLEVRQDELYIKHDKHEYEKSAIHDKEKKPERATKGDLTSSSNTMIGLANLKTHEEAGADSAIDRIFGATPNPAGAKRFSDHFAPTPASAQFNSSLTASNREADSPYIQALFSSSTPDAAPGQSAVAGNIPKSHGGP